jgi:hypothetical protein
MAPRLTAAERIRNLEEELQSLRSDSASFYSIAASVGDRNRDRLAQFKISTPKDLARRELDDLYEGSGLIQKIIDTIPEGICKEWATYGHPEQDSELIQKIQPIAL